MSSQKDLMGVGMPGAQAVRIGINENVQVTAAGTTTGTATVLTPPNRMLSVTTAASQTGVILPANAALFQPYYVTYAGGGQSILVYPPAGAAFNGGSADAAKTITTTAGGAFFIRLSALMWYANVSA